MELEDFRKKHQKRMKVSYRVDRQVPRKVRL